MNPKNASLEMKSNEDIASDRLPVDEGADFFFSGKINKDEDITQNRSPSKPELRAATAFLVFIIYLAGQVVTSIVVTLFAIIKYIVSGGNPNNKDALQGMISGIMPEIVFASALAGAIVFAAGSYIVRKSLKDNSPFGAAWAAGKPKVLLNSILLGVSAALIYFILSIISIQVFSFPPDQKGGLLAQMALQSGVAQFVWITFTLFIAPLVEELLFRGILLGGLNRSFGVWWGIALSNLLFIGLHYSEAIYFWPAFIGIALLSATATRQRLTHKAIGPAVAVHFGYNLSIAGAALIAKMTGGVI